MAQIYFDHSATTPLDPRVVETMLPFYGETFGNPSSLHWAGQQAKQAIDEGRRQVAELFHADPDEIVFTASGTEADNMVLIGVAAQYKPQDCHIITSSFEHPAILETCKHLEKLGYPITYLPVSSDGIVLAESLKQALRPNTRLVSVMAANNVVGTLQPIYELANITKEHGALFHTDAVQAVGKIPLHMDALPVDFLSMSAHKLHGPKGIGALYIRRGVSIEPLVHGGGQERGIRSATENVAGIAGLGKAASIAAEEMNAEARRLVGLRDRVIAEVQRQIPNAYLIGHPYKRLPGHICLGFAGQEGEAMHLMLALNEEGIAISTGSACSSHHAGQSSYILMAMGMDPVRARGSLRITLGRFNTDQEVDTFLQVLPGLVKNLHPITSRNFATVS
ncbi:MAG TPA: cysteine desulfurase family protein [Anaerolineales bacterium]|nr:cysteine desulfurase family protein [Anaerolineales bacterium]